MDWKKPNKGIKQKIYSEGGKRLRLLKFKDDFIEKGKQVDLILFE